MPSSRICEPLRNRCFSWCMLCHRHTADALVAFTGDLDHRRTGDIGINVNLVRHGPVLHDTHIVKFGIALPK